MAKKAWTFSYHLLQLIQHQSKTQLVNRLPNENYQKHLGSHSLLDALTLLHLTKMELPLIWYSHLKLSLNQQLIWEENLPDGLQTGERREHSGHHTLRKWLMSSWQCHWEHREEMGTTILFGMSLPELHQMQKQSRLVESKSLRASQLVNGPMRAFSSDMRTTMETSNRLQIDRQEENGVHLKTLLNYGETKSLRVYL